MSFSSEIKKELFSIKLDDFDLLKSKVYGLVLFSRNFSKEKFSFSSKNKECIDLLSEFLVSNLFIMIEIHTKLHHSKDKNDMITTLSLMSPNDSNKIFNLFYNNSNIKNLYINQENIKKEKQLKAFLSGAFLVCGSISDPNKEYRLEFSIQSGSLANDLLNLILNLPINIKPKLSEKKNKFSIYIKENEQIFDFLVYIGAQNSAMELIQVKMIKEVRNYVNRTTNFQTANLSKTTSASLTQIKAIELIEKEKGMNFLSDDLKELALLRIENPDMSLKELGESLKVPISRSGVNHRLKKIIDMTDNIRKEKV